MQPVSAFFFRPETDIPRVAYTEVLNVSSQIISTSLNTSSGSAIGYLLVFIGMILIFSGIVIGLGKKHEGAFRIY